MVHKATGAWTDIFVMHNTCLSILAKGGTLHCQTRADSTMHASG